MPTNFDRRVAMLILPLRDNTGRQTTAAHAALRASVLEAFGGYTQSLVTGAWISEDGETFTDDSLKYEIVMTAGKADGEQLVAIAAAACRAADQQCVMIQLASGVVHFVKQNGDL